MSTKIMSRPILIVAAATMLTSGVGYYIWDQEHRPPLLEIYIFSLKNSQSIFIRTPDDKRILINGGGNSEVIRHISKVLPFYSRRIDSIVATDFSDNHISGLIDVVDRYHISDVFVPGVTLESLGIGSSTGKASKTFLQTLRKHSIPLRETLLGISNKGGQGEGVPDMGSLVDVRALFPVPAGSFAYSKASAPEIILKIIHGSNEFVLAGEATKKVQTYISTSTRAENSLGGDRVLIVATSGTASELSRELFDTFNPTHLFFSKAVSYQLPKSPKKIQGKSLPRDSLTQSRLEKINIRELGGVKIVSDGKNIRVSPLK